MKSKYTIAELDEQSFTEDDSNETPPSDIVAYNELRSCADLYRMHTDEVLQIDPDFQRDFVWNDTNQTRFVDSLIKQLPIPSMCFAFDYKTDRWMVIDGLQRISTIIRFLSAGDWRLSKLADIEVSIAGKTAFEIKKNKTESRNLFARVQNQTLPINVLRCDFSNKRHMEYLFTIFHRLNSGGSKLNNQEIRNCIYGGDLNQLLKKLDKTENWRTINGMTEDHNYRFVKQELILRFFAFFEKPKSYSGQIAKFLNNYMHENRWLKKSDLSEKEQLFERVTKLIRTKIFPSGPTKKIPTSVMEAMLVAVAKNIDFLEKTKSSDLKSMYSQLRNDENFRDEAVAEGLSKVDKVSSRFAAAQKIFKTI